MAYAHRLQGSRYEFKYIVPEAMVRPLRDFARSYLVPDEHADPANNWEYEVHSLYLDSPALSLCQATMRGHKNRFKLRIRFYDDDPAGPVFFEIKRRESDVILKQRAKVRRTAVRDLLAGHWPERSYLANGGNEANDYGALQQFCFLRDHINAQGQAFVSYTREAYVTANDNSVRMTFDRQINGRRFAGAFGLTDGTAPVYPKVDGTVLELKFTNRFPNWMREMCRVFDLERTSMAKYVSCITRLAARSPEAAGRALEFRP
ncbi:MAG TPA: polyphosphate polymerase domain-containing protein [Phycisphaerae bacterium]|nr:polyphosphate polymerase domain-containing protein [Phycisphaerae bacterium]